MIKAKFTCPYCGVENHRVAQIDLEEVRTIVCCDSDEGGCDKYYVAAYYTEIVVQEFKIEERGR